MEEEGKKEGEEGKGRARTENYWIHPWYCIVVLTYLQQNLRTSILFTDESCFNQ